MKELSKFKIKENDPIIVQVKAFNGQGWSQWSPTATIGQVNMPVPLKQGKLKLTKKTQNKITLVWDKLFSTKQHNTYEVYWSVDGQFIKFATVKDNWLSLNS